MVLRMINYLSSYNSVRCLQPGRFCVIAGPLKWHRVNSLLALIRATHSIHLFLFTAVYVDKECYQLKATGYKG